jgi:hypothetical protein
MDHEHHHEHHAHRHQAALKSYQPLIVIAAVVVLAALAVGRPVVTNAMGLFFCLLAMFKFFDLKGFADGFQNYDIVAQKFRGYAYAYSVMELLLGLGYLRGLHLNFINLVTVALMGVSAIGVFKGMKKGGLSCACLGTALNVPLSSVSLVETVGMGLMATWMLL